MHPDFNVAECMRNCKHHIKEFKGSWQYINSFSALLLYHKRQLKMVVQKYVIRMSGTDTEESKVLFWDEFLKFCFLSCTAKRMANRLKLLTSDPKATKILQKKAEQLSRDDESNNLKRVLIGRKTCGIGIARTNKFLSLVIKPEVHISSQTVIKIPKSKLSYYKEKKILQEMIADTMYFPEVQTFPSKLVPTEHAYIPLPSLLKALIYMVYTNPSLHSQVHWFYDVEKKTTLLNHFKLKVGGFVLWFSFVGWHWFNYVCAFVESHCIASNAKVCLGLSIYF